MGTGNSKDDTYFAELSDNSRFSTKELKEWHAKFMKDYPTGYIDKTAFKEMYAKLFPNGHKAVEGFVEHNFRLFDVNGDGQVDFREFMIGFGMHSRGTVNEKFAWMYSLFDIDGNNEITKTEMTTILKSLYKMLDLREGDVEQYVEELYEKFDVNKDNVLSSEEFLKLAKQDKKLVAKVFGYGLGNSTKDDPV